MTRETNLETSGLHNKHATLFSSENSYSKEPLRVSGVQTQTYLWVKWMSADWKAGIRFPLRGRDFLRRCIQTGCGSYPVCCLRRRYRGWWYHSMSLITHYHPVPWLAIREYPSNTTHMCSWSSNCRWKYSINGEDDKSFTSHRKTHIWYLYQVLCNNCRN